VQYRRDERQKFESIIDSILDNFIKLMCSKLTVHTAAIFFPQGDGGYRLRRYFSVSEHINKEAVIYPGVGVIGSFLKDGMRQLNLEEIVSDSMTLYYYTRDAGIRSLMASPIMADGDEKGCIIVDSTEKKHFSDEDLAYLNTLAAILGQSVWHTYLYNEHRLDHLRLSSMSSIEKDFFLHLNMDTVLDRMVEIIPFAIRCDRLSISLRAANNKEGVVVRTWGKKVGSFQDLRFPLEGKTLIALLYGKNIPFYRNFTQPRYEPRYTEVETGQKEFASFLAVPIGVDECKGTILLESVRKDTYLEVHANLLSRLATSAGLAMEKIGVLEKARTLATHDGLTGLTNHREFQLLLKDEMNRAKRYNDELVVVLCDIDFFKKLNDNYGHPFGDIVLKGVSAKLHESIREAIDISARYGGEEFALVLVKTSKEQAYERVEKIRENIANLVFRNERGEDVKVTMSFGIANYENGVKDSGALVKRADKALYKAKENGRNRVEIF